MTQTRRQKKRLKNAELLYGMFKDDKRTVKSVSQYLKQVKDTDRRIEKGKGK
jgi:hypothetical protein